MLAMPFLAFLLGVAATLMAVLILIPIKLTDLRPGLPRKALAGAILAVPLAMVAAFGSGGRSAEPIAPGLPMQPVVQGADVIGPTAGGMKQDADWSLLSHVYLGGPPPTSGANAAAVASAPAQQRAQMSAAELTDVTRREPGNAEAWLALANAHRVAREFPAAVSAYETGLKLDARNADAWADYADALASVNGRQLAGAPAKAISRALAIDANHLKGLWLAASLDLELHHYKDALARWQKLRGALPQGSPDAAIIDANIGEARQLTAATGSGK